MGALPMRPVDGPRDTTVVIPAELPGTLRHFRVPVMILALPQYRAGGEFDTDSSGTPPTNAKPDKDQRQHLFVRDSASESTESSGASQTAGLRSCIRPWIPSKGFACALKVPHSSYIDEEVLKDFRTEVRLTARLDHPHILPLKNASFIDDSFVIVFPLGLESFHERMRRRMSLPTLLDFAEQMISAVAYAHRQRIIHCDIKPENYILFPGNRLRLTDFGIAKVAQRQCAPREPGRWATWLPNRRWASRRCAPTFFRWGCILYRMIAGELPEWPYEWPLAGTHSPHSAASRPAFIEFHPQGDGRQSSQTISRRQQNARRVSGAEGKSALKSRSISPTSTKRRHCVIGKIGSRASFKTREWRAAR